MTRLFLILLSLVAAWTPVLRAARGDADIGRMVLEQFRTRGVTDDQRTQWEIKGGNAVVDGPQVLLENIELTFRSAKGDTVFITSPRCSFNRATQTGSSDAPLHVRNPMVTVDGVGYDILAAQQLLHIRTQVRMWIKTQDGTPSDALLKTGRVKAKDANPADASADKQGRVIKQRE